MRYLILSFFLMTGNVALAQFGGIGLPDSPLDTSMGDAAGNTAGTLNQLEPIDEFEREQEEERQEELLENRYDVPDEEEDEEFNKNGPSGV